MLTSPRAELGKHRRAADSYPIGGQCSSVLPGVEPGPIHAQSAGNPRADEADLSRAGQIGEVTVAHRGPVKVESRTPGVVEPGARQSKDVPQAGTNQVDLPVRSEPVAAEHPAADIEATAGQCHPARIAQRGAG
jgi:hypothetical protein